MAFPAKLLYTLPFIILFISFVTLRLPKTHPANQVLKDYDILLNLVPAWARSYTLNKDTGEFKVNIGSNTCKFTVDGSDYMLKSTITGMISSKKLSNVKGVSAEFDSIWVEVDEIFFVGDQMYVVQESYVEGSRPEINQSEKLLLPECGCGLTCKGLNFIQKKMKQMITKLLKHWSL